MSGHAYVSLERRRWYESRIVRAAGVLTWVCAVAYVQGGFGTDTASPAWLRDLGGAAFETDASGHRMLSKRAAFAAVASGDYATRATCADVDFAYCGQATCRLNGDGLTASCGCQRERGSRGRLFLNANAAFLVYAEPARRALYDFVVAGDKHAFAKKLCAAVAAGTLWRDAGFDADVGSFADPAGAAWAQHDIGCSETGAYFLADCEGAPCAYEAFDATYDAICTCPYVEASMNATVSTKKIRRATAKSCRELSAAHGDCAIQETLLSGEVMPDYAAMETLHAAIKAADFRTGGTDCKVHEFSYSYSYRD